ncbi:MAG: hypothetical protein Fur003_0880 [Candidatus Dojkabacteria bacterium]
MKLLLVLLVMFVGYGLAFYLIIRAFLVGYSLSHNEVPYVPVGRKILKLAMQKLAIKPGDKVVDIGAGDGKPVFFMAHANPKADFVGVEYNKALVWWAKFHKLFRNLRNVKLINADAFNYDFSQFNKVYLYMTPQFNHKLMPILQRQLKSGAIVVAVTFGFNKPFEEAHASEIQEFYLGESRKRKDRVSVWIKK